MESAQAELRGGIWKTLLLLDKTTSDQADSVCGCVERELKIMLDEFDKQQRSLLSVNDSAVCQVHDCGRS